MMINLKFLARIICLMMMETFDKNIYTPVISLMNYHGGFSIIAI